MLTALLLLVGIANVAVLGWVGWQLKEILAHVRKTGHEVSEAKTFFRSRVSRASMQSGATSPERELTRLGRASAARRVVVGGDPDSQLHADLLVDPGGLPRQSSARARRSGGGEDG